MIFVLVVRSILSINIHVRAHAGWGRTAMEPDGGGCAVRSSQLWVQVYQLWHGQRETAAQEDEGAVRRDAAAEMNDEYICVTAGAFLEALQEPADFYFSSAVTTKFNYFYLLFVFLRASGVLLSGWHCTGTI